MAYYYLGASLPAVLFSTKPALTWEEFLEYSKGALPENKYHFLSSLSLEMEGDLPSGASPLIEKYQAFERSLHRQLARLRKKNHDLAGEVPEDEGIDPPNYVVKNLYPGSNPLELEEKLDALRWSKIEDLSAGHFFDWTFLESYALKLQLAWKIQNRTPERGREARERAYQSILSQIKD